MKDHWALAISQLEGRVDIGFEVAHLLSQVRTESGTCCRCFAALSPNGYCPVCDGEGLLDVIGYRGGYIGSEHVHIVG